MESVYLLLILFPRSPSYHQQYPKRQLLGQRSSTKSCEVSNKNGIFTIDYWHEISSASTVSVAEHYSETRAANSPFFLSMATISKEGIRRFSRFHLKNTSSETATTYRKRPRVRMTGYLKFGRRSPKVTRGAETARSPENISARYIKTKNRRSIARKIN